MLFFSVFTRTFPGCEGDMALVASEILIPPEIFTQGGFEHTQGQERTSCPSHGTMGFHITFKEMEHCFLQINIVTSIFIENY